MIELLIVVAIILNACVSLTKTTVHGWAGLLLVALAFAAQPVLAADAKKGEQLVMFTTATDLDRKAVADGMKGLLRVDYVHRDFGSFYTELINLDTGESEVIFTFPDSESEMPFTMVHTIFTADGRDLTLIETPPRDRPLLRQQFPGVRGREAGRAANRRRPGRRRRRGPPACRSRRCRATMPSLCAFAGDVAAPHPGFGVLRTGGPLRASGRGRQGGSRTKQGGA